MSENHYKFDLPSHHKSIIKVIGVGGGGSNAVNHMYLQGIKDVEFIVCNTDAQALKASPVPHKLQIGVHLTDGLGAGANPEKGRNAALESRDEIREFLNNNTKMVFITAGMGGGTGTGAAPIIARLAREMEILTVGICTAPFGFEGKKKKQQADIGIAELKEYCDTVLVINNDKLREIFGNLSIREAFAEADNVLTNAAKSIAEIITVTSEVNVDFEDVKTVMSNSGAAVMGSAVTSGENRARRAAQEALNSPLLNNTDIHGAKKILLSITSGEQAQLKMDELTEITDYIEERAGDGAEVIFGEGIDPTLGESIRVTVIATGFFEKEIKVDKKTVFDLESDKQINLFNGDSGLQKTPSLYNFEPYKEPERELKQEVKAEFRPEFKPEFKSEIKEELRTQLRQEPSAEFKQEPPQDTPAWENKVYFDLQSPNPEPKVEIEKKQDYHFEFKSEPKPEPTLFDEAEERRSTLSQQSLDRIKKLKGLSSSHNMNPDEFKEKLEVPAYMRKNVNLPDYPHSSEKSISRFNLNDENEILGNNKFLHDNVD